MSKASSWLGVAIFVVVFVRQASRHGQTWEFSSHGIPVSLLSPDGERYRNGEAIDPISHARITALARGIKRTHLLSRKNQPCRDSWRL
jgi:hypothetical protein